MLLDQWKEHICYACSVIRPPEYIIPLAGIPWLPLETAPVLELATVALIYPQLMMPREGRSPLLEEQIQTEASQMCTPWIWVRSTAAKHSWLCATRCEQSILQNTRSNQIAGFSSKEKSASLTDFSRPLAHIHLTRASLFGGRSDPLWAHMEPRTSSHWFIKYFSRRHRWLPSLLPSTYIMNHQVANISYLHPYCSILTTITVVQATVPSQLDC